MQVVWRKGSARALETHTGIVCDQGFTQENCFVGPFPLASGRGADKYIVSDKGVRFEL